MKIEPNQSFGLIVGGTLLILFTIMPITSGSSINIYTTLIGLFFIFSAIFEPQILTPFKLHLVTLKRIFHNSYSKSAFDKKHLVLADLTNCTKHQSTIRNVDFNTEFNFHPQKNRP